MAVRAKERSLKRGWVYHCNLGVGIGSEMQKLRPCIIVQNDIANKKSPNTIVVPITHDPDILPMMVPLTSVLAEDETLLLDGSANTSCIVCVNKARLGDYICKILPSDMKKIDEAIAKSVDIMKYYADKTSKLENLTIHLETVKHDRNHAQDILKEISDRIFEIVLYFKEKESRTDSFLPF